MVSRTRVVAADGVGGDFRSKGALEVMIDLLHLYPTLDRAAPFMQTYSIAGWWVINRRGVTHAFFAHGRRCRGKGSFAVGFALGENRGTPQLAAQGATVVQVHRAGRWKSLAFLVYVRADRERAEFVSQALMHYALDDK